MAKTRRARIDAENDHRRVTRPRLRIIVKETQSYLTGYLRARSDTIIHGPESREVGYGFSIILHGHWLYIDTKTTQKSLHMRLPPFSSQEPAWGLRLIAALAPPGDFFGEIIEKKKKKAGKKNTSTGRGRWSCGGLRRAALEVTVVFCGHGRWFILEVFLGFSIWRLKRHNPSFALVAAPCHAAYTKQAPPEPCLYK